MLKVGFMPFSRRPKESGCPILARSLRRVGTTGPNSITTRFNEDRMKGLVGQAVLIPDLIDIRNDRKGHELLVPTKEALRFAV
jgi:hypothetical protein